MKKLIVLLCCLSILLPAAMIIPASATPTSYTYADIVAQMLDLKRLAKLPQTGEKGDMASTYDRNSEFNESTEQYIDWRANGDNSGYISKVADKDIPGGFQ